MVHNTNNPILDSLLDQNNNILTHPTDISNKIFIQQSLINAPTIQNCHYQSIHSLSCICNVQQYPWHDITGFILDKRGNPNIPLSTYFDCNTNDTCLKQLSKNKTFGLDKIPYSILKHLPHHFHTMLFLFF